VNVKPAKTLPATALDDTALDAMIEDAVRTEFRAINTPDGRKGMRLEHVFWASLDRIAAQQGLSRSQLLRQILSHSGASEANASSVVRSFVAAQLDRENQTLRQELDPLRALRLLQQAPVPSFALDRQKQLVQVNPEFVQYLRSIVGPRQQVVSPDVARLSLDRPVEEIFAELAPGRTVRSVAIVRVDNAQRRAVVRLHGVPPYPPRLLVGYVT
jgi:predicted DNA-binding ribbon-helix-helix protein